MRPWPVKAELLQGFQADLLLGVAKSSEVVFADLVEVAAG